ncbi:synaptotagmin-like protein 1 [Osmerus eperlanus]|uniref:synaptotagmin-like protein 1 n=1 Tax=Osmerus eperlanus TaxID=29151 RepID=UPI002E0EBA01
MEGEGEDSLDLSHLTDAEQAAILEVLLRDDELRRCEEGRVRSLREKEADPALLRTLSGAWFSEERSKRHRNTKQGCDLVQSSIRHRRSKTRDVALSDIFNGANEEVRPGSPGNSPSPRAEGRPGEDSTEETEEEVIEQDPASLIPLPAPRTRNLHTQDSNTISSSTDIQLPLDYASRRNGHKEEDRWGDSDEDTDSVSSDVTEADPTPLRPSSSVSSLQSNNMLNGSMMSLFTSGEFGAVEVRGRILFSLLYDKQKEELKVKVCCCEDLAPARKNRSDPYVKAYLLPDKSYHSKKKTSVRKKTLNPVYDQTLKYKVRVGDLRCRTLNLSVWHAVPMGRNMFLGEVELSLGHWDWTSTQPLWQDLQPRVQLTPDSLSSRGTIFLSIKFSPAGSEDGGMPLTGEVHIWLREAQGLLSTKGGTVDSYVKSYVLPDASRSSGQKTRVVKRSISPTYNHTMVYDGFQSADLREACTELIVWQRDGLKTHVLGGVRLSLGTGQSYGEAVCWMDSTEEERKLWTSMIKNPNHWMEATLPIRTNLTQRPE